MKDKKKRKATLKRDPLLAKKNKVRTKKRSEMETSSLNSTVQNDATDFDEPLVGDMLTLSTIPSHDEQESISFDINYDDVPLQSNEPEVVEENETSKEPSVPAWPVKTDKSTQMKYDKFALCAKIENNILRNEIKTIKLSKSKDLSNPMAHEVVLASSEKINILLVHSQLSFRLYMIF